jgi:hypothetical protein
LDKSEVCGSLDHSTNMHSATKRQRNNCCGALKLKHTQLPFGPCKVKDCKHNFCPKIKRKIDGVPEETMCIQYQVNNSKPYNGRDPKQWPDYGGGCRCRKDELTYPRATQPKAEESNVCGVSSDSYDSLGRDEVSDSSIAGVSQSSSSGCAFKESSTSVRSEESDSSEKGFTSGD